MLALLGGKPVRSKAYPPHITTGAEEKKAVMRVLDSGVLSAYEGSNNKNFMGGPEVQALEKEWAERFNAKFAVALNSATSALMAAEKWFYERKRASAFYSPTCFNKRSLWCFLSTIHRIAFWTTSAKASGF